jgi:hypothetical protein
MKHIFALTLFTSVYFFFVPHVQALTVSPAKQEVRANPGQTLKGEIELFNEQNEVKTFYTSFENFESRGDSGAPYFVGANEGLATWMKSEESVTVAPGDRVKVPYTITIPQSAKPGGYFAAQFFGTEKPKAGEGDLAIGGKIGVLFLLRVNGDVEEAAGVAGFTTAQNQYFFVSLPIRFEYLVNNTGGDRIVPKGTVFVQNTLRMKTELLSANEKEGSVLPNGSRTFPVWWGDPAKDAECADKNDFCEEGGFFSSVAYEWKNFHVGWYTATLDVSWGEKGSSMKDTVHFFIFPWRLLLVVGGGVIVLWMLLRKYNSYIIAKATKK